MCLMPYLIASDELNVRGEEQVYQVCHSYTLDAGEDEGSFVLLQAAVAWLRHDVKERCSQVSSVLENIRFCLLTPKFLVNVVSQEPLVRGDEAVRNLLDEGESCVSIKVYLCHGC